MEEEEYRKYGLSKKDEEWMDYTRQDFKAAASKLTGILYEIICRIESLHKRIEKLEKGG